MKQFKLENGLTLVVVPKNNQGNVTVSVSVGVGHNNETVETLGLCALYESVLLKQAFGIQAMYGGTITTFITDTEVGMLEQVFDEMAKLIVCPNLDQKLVDVAAADIVRHTKDMAPLVRRQLKLLYKHTAYANDKIVWDTQSYINSVQGFKTKNLQKHHDRYYVGKNLVLEVSGGGIDCEEVLELADLYFGSIPAGKKNPAPKHFYTGGFAQIPAEQMQMLLFGWDVSDLSNVSEANVMMHMLRGRLERSFSGTDVAFGVKIAGYYGRRSLQISVQTQNTPLNQCIDVVTENVKRLKGTLASDRRLESSRNLAMAEKLFLFERPIEGAYEIGWQILGRGDMYSVQERISSTWKVTARDVQEIAQHIFARKLTLVAAANEPLYDYEDVCNKM